MVRKLLKAATLMELLVIITLIMAVLLTVSGVGYFTQIRKATDARKKVHLETFKKSLEDFHSDKSRYPNLNEIGYELMGDRSNWNNTETGAVKICGNENYNPIMQDYFNQFPCHAASPGEDYVYFLVNGGQEFAIYTTLENETDPIIEDLGCQYGCSYFTNTTNPSQNISVNMFNYYVSSSGFYQVHCTPDSYVACYPGLPSAGDRCQWCEYGTCANQSYERLFCHPMWCESHCR